MRGAADPAAAAQALLRIVVYLSTGDAGRQNLGLWQGALERILPGCGSVPAEMAPLLDAAWRFQQARGARAQDHALQDLRHQVHVYFGRRAVGAMQSAGVSA